jgi:hypothetical protein
MLNASIGEEQNIFFESVFVLSEVGNVVVSRLRDGEQHSSLYRYVAYNSVYEPHTIQVWGIASFIVVTGLSTASYLINESQLHTFFVYIHSHIGANVGLIFKFTN